MSASTGCLDVNFGEMAIEIPERVSEDLRKRLSVAVRSVQWSYGIFWSPKQGKLIWGDGYYNGEIKTRKKVPAAKVCADTLGFCRSDQLRELHDYESIQEKKKEPKLGSPRPDDALSREELSDLEKYYLGRMAEDYNASKCLPGKALEADHPPVFWIASSQLKGKKEKKDAEFTQSKEAKKASVKTVICFRHGDGVLELGVTDLVEKEKEEVPNLIQHIKTSLMELDQVLLCNTTKEQLDVVGHTSDSDENLKVVIIEEEVRIEVTSPSTDMVRIVVTFAERDRLLNKARLAIYGVANLVVTKFQSGVLDASNNLPAKQEVRIEAKFPGSNRELANSIKQAVLNAIRAVPEQRRTMPIINPGHA